MSYIDSIKKRTLTVFSLLGFAIFPIFGLKDGYLGLAELFEYQPVIIFDRFDIFALLSPACLWPMLFPIGYYFIYLKKVSIQMQKKVTTIMSYGAITAFLAVIVFSMWYTSHLEQQDYIRCSGRPTGYFPGMAVKFAKDQSLCKEKRRLIYNEE